MTENVTIFKNVRDTTTPFYRKIDTILERISAGSSKDLIKKIRSEKDKSTRQSLKTQLPAICFSGTFNKRSDKSIEDHSGFICLDFDGYEKKKDLIADKEKLSKDKHVFCVFISPSGNGLKAIIKIPAEIENHIRYFNALEAHFNSPRFDTTSKNISRVCYESYDPMMYINKDSVLWDKLQEIEHKEIIKSSGTPTIPITDENKIVEILVKWWTKKFPMIEGQRNHNCYILSAALNEYGINKSLAVYIMSGYTGSEFTESEANATIDSAYSSTEKFGTKYYEDKDRVDSTRRDIRKGIPKNEIRNKLSNLNLSSDTIDSVINNIEAEDEHFIKFWSKSDKGIIKVIHLYFKDFLESQGFFKYCPEDGKNHVFVRMRSNLIDHTSEKEIKDFVLAKLIKLEDMSIYNYFADNTRFFKEEFLSLLSTVDIHFKEDTKDTAYLYFNNGVVKIEKDKVEKIEYINLGGHVWKDHIIDRSFDLCQIDRCDYRKFIGNISKNDPHRIASMESAIGFLMHGYKNLSYCPAVILNDEEYSEDPEGGTGKGIFMKALSHMKKVVTIDGKSFTFESSFAYQLVSADTQILVFDDIRSRFPFIRLFSVVTEGLTLEKKNKDAIKIPFSKSPKIAITTNYTIEGQGNSFARRKFELELHKYYNKDFTPLDDFNKLMFGDWDDKEWCSFDNYMIRCLQGYLKTSLVASRSATGKLKQFSVKTNHQFTEWCGLLDGNDENELLLLHAKINVQECYNDFIQQNPDYGSYGSVKLSRIKFGKFLKYYAEYKTGNFEDGRDAFGQWIKILPPK